MSDPRYHVQRARAYKERHDGLDSKLAHLRGKRDKVNEGIKAIMDERADLVAKIHVENAAAKEST